MAHIRSYKMNVKRPNVSICTKSRPASFSIPTNCICSFPHVTVTCTSSLRSLRKRSCRTLLLLGSFGFPIVRSSSLATSMHSLSFSNSSGNSGLLGEEKRGVGIFSGHWEGLQNLSSGTDAGNRSGQLNGGLS